MKHKNDYFAFLIKQVSFAEISIKKLQNYFSNFDISLLNEVKNEIHKIENEADDFYFEVLEKLSKEFITVIDQEDILTIVQKLDDLMDVIDEVLINFYMYNLKVLPKYAISLTQIAKRCVDALLNVVKEFKNYKKSKSLDELLKVIPIYEKEADNIFIEAIHELYEKENDFKVITGHREVYLDLENICDTTNEIVELINQIIIKNT